MVRAHLGPLNNQPLTIYFVGGFFFGASLVPGFDQDLADSYCIEVIFDAVHCRQKVGVITINPNLLIIIPNNVSEV